MRMVLYFSISGHRKKLHKKHLIWPEHTLSQLKHVPDHSHIAGTNAQD